MRIGYRVIQHGPYTATEGPHIHINAKNGPDDPTDFMHEGMTPDQQRKYSEDDDDNDSD